MRWPGVIWLVLVAAIGSLPESASAQRLDSSIAIGRGVAMWSAVLSERRDLLVYLPPGYDKSDRKYPVLYLLDGEAHFQYASGIVGNLIWAGRIPEMILVGIPNTDRVRDFTPATRVAAEQQGIWSSSGSASAFLKFLVEELVPWIDARYRTQPFRGLFGHSLGGLFVTEALAAGLGVFQAYFIVSPAWISKWDGGQFAQKLGSRIAHLAPAPVRFVELAWGGRDTDEIRRSALQLQSLLGSASPGALQWHADSYPNEGHATAPLRALLDGLEFVFADWQLPSNESSESLAQIDERYARLSKKYGFEAQAPPRALSKIAARFLEQGQKEASLSLLRETLRRYPLLDAEFTYRYLGHALESLGRLQEARAAYQRSFELSIEGGDFLGGSTIYAHGEIDRLEKKMQPASPVR